MVRIQYGFPIPATVSNSNLLEGEGFLVSEIFRNLGVMGNFHPAIRVNKVVEATGEALHQSNSESQDWRIGEAPVIGVFEIAEEELVCSILMVIIVAAKVLQLQ